MEKKTLTKVEPQTIAASLYDVQGQIALLKEQEEALREQLFNNLKEQGVKSVRLTDGTAFIITERQTLKIKDEEKAEKWLDENFCWKPDTGKALKILRRSLKKLPAYFAVSTSEFLTVKRSTEDAEE